VGCPRGDHGAGRPDLGRGHPQRHRSTLAKADQLGARSLALVAFGTGVGGFPLGEAARIEVEEVRRHLEKGSGLERIVFAVRGEGAEAAFRAAIS
jgi:O-acetyl-ADP-ribose deacetylase (regulator of RNase III)